MRWLNKILSKFALIRIPVVFSSNDTINAGDSFYEETADIYTSLFSSKKYDDIPMYLSYAQRTGSPVLEAASGDGRIAIPLAQNGFTVFCFDISAKMLSLCLSRINKLQPDEKSRIHIIRSLMQHMPFKSAFKLALIPYNSFNHLLTEEEQRSCLEGLYRALKKGGLLVMEVLPFHKRYDTKFRERSAGMLTAGNSRVRVYSRVRHNAPNKLHTVYWYIATERPGKPPQRIISHFTRKDIELKQVEQLLRTTGFTIEEIKYSYSREDKTKDKRIIIAKK